MGLLTQILAFIGWGQSALPVLEKLLGGFGKLVGDSFGKLFGADAAAKLNSVLQEAESGVAYIDGKLPEAIAFVKTTYTDLDGLFGAFPGLAKELHVATVVAKGQGVPAADVRRIVPPAHANVTIAKA
jgi:hypothetical protein